MELLQQIKDFLIPELDAIRQEQSAVRERLNAIDLHLVDQSRRIDALNQRIDQVHDDLLGRIDKVNTDLIARIDKVNADLTARVDESYQRMDKQQADFLARIDETNKRIDESNKRIDETHRRLDRLYEVIVRRDEHVGLENWVRELDRRLGNLERRAA